MSGVITKTDMMMLNRVALASPNVRYLLCATVTPPSRQSFHWWLCRLG